MVGGLVRKVDLSSSSIRAEAPIERIEMSMPETRNDQHLSSGDGGG